MKYYFLLLGTLVIVCVGCTADGQQILDNRQSDYHAPPASMQARPGPMVDGPGPGVMPAMAPAPRRTFATETTQVRFLRPAGMQIGWKSGDRYAEGQLTAPGRYNFRQGATYRLKLTDIPGPGREGLTLYPTLQIYPAHPTTDAYLSHNSVPLQITDEDLEQVETNNFVTKVIYLPDPKFQELAIAGVETLVSTRLDPGVDPVAEADQRGTIMAVLRMGNMDLEMPGRNAGAPGKGGAAAGNVQPVSHRQSGNGKYTAPTPVGGAGTGMQVPGPMITGTPGGPGQPPYSPVSGRGGAPKWGQPMTGTPIGLPGPPHLPYGGPAGLKSHTVRNRTKTDLHKPVDHMLIDVKHEPGLRMPKPVKYIEYTEKHPEHSRGERSYPASSLP